MTPVQLLLVDDHRLVRAGIRALLDEIEDFEVVGEAANGRQAVELAASLRPDVVLMDISMPELNGLEATARIVKAQPRARVLILSIHAEPEYVPQALRAGAVGFLLKDASTAELDLAIRSVARGGTYLSPAVSKSVVDEYLALSATELNPLARLTPRQREVLQLVAEGHTTKSIAQRLGVSAKTVETHRTQLMHRLDIHDVAGLVRLAVRLGLVSTELPGQRRRRAH